MGITTCWKSGFHCPNSARILSRPTCTNLRAFSITFTNPDPSRATSYNWISMKPPQKFNPVWDPESSQMPSKENSQEDIASCHHSFSEMLIEGLHNLALSPGTNYTHTHTHTPEWLLLEQDTEEEMQQKRPLEQPWLLWKLKD